MNVISAQFRASAKQAMRDIFDSFKRSDPIRFYKTAKSTITFDPDYSGHWDKRNNKNIKVPEFRDIECVLIFEERQPYESFIKGADTNVRFGAFYNRIKVRVDKSDYDFLKDSKKFIFKDIEYSWDGVPRGMGILEEIDYYEIVLQRVN